MSMESNGERAHIKIGLVGPRGVGKTSLVTAMIKAGKKSLSGTPVSLAPNARSQTRIDRFAGSLRGSINVGEFDAPALEPTKDLDNLEFDLTIDRDPSIGIGFDILDFPGGWLTLTDKPTRYEEFRRHLDQSAVLIVPIDATYVMEAKESWVRRGLPGAMRVEEVQELVREWAKSRNRPGNREEPAVLMIVPVKCESYFDDNGGRSDRSDALRSQVMHDFNEVIAAAREEAVEARLEVDYCPVDTLGCVDLETGNWTLDSDQLPAFVGHFKLRSGAQLSYRGAAELMYVIASHLVGASERLEKPEADGARRRAEKAARKATEDRGFIGNIWWAINGTRRDLEAKAAKKDRVAALKLERLEHITNALTRLSHGPSEGRLRKVGDV